MNVAVAIAAMATVTVTTKVTFGKVRKRFSGDLVEERGSDGCRSEEIEGEVGF